MPSIHVMSPTLASQVAAGEVVERPASVVKELVENSLDAGAKFVRVEIRRGGVGMIKVTDDGSGMSRADAELCTKRHATSKLSSLEELFEITHLGFRGEALPSIASVSRFKLCTRQQQDLEGWEIRIDGGLEHEPRSSGVSPGTAIEVADLFYNTPARRKFLKSAETEASHVEHQIRLHALAYPQVRFAYKRDDQLVFDLPATADLRVRISALTDAATAAALIPIETTIGPGISITGFLLPLSEARRTRKGQYVFMNTRPVEDQLINRAIRDGYGGFPTGLHPALFLYMEVEPALVDVNVHPAKKEVRFRRSADVVNTIVEAIANTLQSTPGRNPRCRRAGAGENSSSCPFYHRAVWGNTRPFHQPRFCFPGGRQTGPCFFRRPTAAFLLCQTIPWACPSPYPPGHSLETGSRHPGETGFSPSGG